MITIYWGINPSNPEGLECSPPQPIMNKFFNDHISEDVADEIRYNRCPALFNELINVYGMKSVYDCGIQVRGNEISIKSPDFITEEMKQSFFENNVTIHSMKGRLFSFNQALVFFTETPSLIMSQLPAFMEDNNIVKNTICIPGQFDIGKYFRLLDFGWHFKKGCNVIEFSREEISFYLRFHTKEKIKFQRFLFTPELMKLYASNQCINARKISNSKSDMKTRGLNFYYNMFSKGKFKNKMLKIIKENLFSLQNSPNTK